MKRVLTSMRAIASVLALSAGCAAAAETYTVPPDLWDRPRSARMVMDQPAVREAVGNYLAAPGRRMVIHHAAGQEPLLYAEELKSWLIALAVNGEDISLRADRNRLEPLTLEVIP